MTLLYLNFRPGYSGFRVQGWVGSVIQVDEEEIEGKKDKNVNMTPRQTVLHCSALPSPLTGHITPEFPK